MRKLIILILLLILLAVGVNATDTYSQGIFWWGEANAGLDVATCNYCGYSMNYPSPLLNVNESTYNACDITASSFTPVVIDVDGDSFGEIITGSGSNLYVYDRNCNLIDQVSLLENLNYGQPGVTNTDSDSYVDLIIGGDRKQYVYEWIPIQNGFVLQDTITNTSTYAIISSRIVCPYLADTCLSINADTGASQVYTTKIDLVSKTTSTTDRTPSFYPISAITTGVPFYKQVLGGTILNRIPVCSLLGSGSHEFTCAIFDGDGANLGNYSIHTTNSNAHQLSEYDTYFAKLGSATRLFSYYSADYTSSAPDYTYEGIVVSDTTTYTASYSDVVTHIYNYTGIGRWYSNIAVGDFNKDGSNDFCYMRWSDNTSGVTYTGYSKTYLTCKDSSFSTLLDIDVTGNMTMNNIVMGDFYPSSSYMGFATYEGIYYVSGGSIIKLLDSGHSGRSYFGYPIIYIDGSAGAPIVVFTDSSYGFIMKSAEIGTSCGDGDCTAYENAFNCPEDCSLNATDSSTPYESGQAPTGTAVGLGNQELCESGYIEYGKCSLRPGGRDCTADSQCLSGNCDGAICSEAGSWAGIDQFVKGSFGSDETSLVFISMFIIIALTIGVIIAAHGSLAGVIAGVGIMIVTLIFFTIVGWLPIFFLFGIILLLIIGVVFMLLINNGG